MKHIIFILVLALPLPALALNMNPQDKITLEIFNQLTYDQQIFYLQGCMAGVEIYFNEVAQHKRETPFTQTLMTYTFDDFIVLLAELHLVQPKVAHWPTCYTILNTIVAPKDYQPSYNRR